MFIIDDIIKYWIDRFLDWLFPKKEKNEKLVGLLLDREKIIQIIQSEKNNLLEEKQKLIEEFHEERAQRQFEEHKIFNALRKKGLSVEKLIEKYDKPLFAILVSYASQQEDTGRGYSASSHFLREEFEKYGSKYLGGTDAIIPPAKIPKWIKNKKDMEIWFKKDILKERYCKIKFMVLVDLKKMSFWGTYLDYDQKNPMHWTIGEALNIEDIFSEEDVNKISFEQIIRGGDIVWLASTFLNEEELDILVKNQKDIESYLKNPSLRNLTDAQYSPYIKEALMGLLENPDQIAEHIINEARYWETKLKNY